jgi:hypothetical protein
MLLLMIKSREKKAVTEIVTRYFTKIMHAQPTALFAWNDYPVSAHKGAGVVL